MDHAITKAEMIEVLDRYFTPIFQILGGIAAVIVIGAACYLVLRPFIRRV